LPELTVAAIRTILASAGVEEIAGLMHRFAADTRPGVVEAVEAGRKRLARHKAELRRLESLFSMQRDLHARGIVAGVDEVGRGALAGPVSAAAVVLSVEARIVGLNDSKLLTPDQRVQVAGEIVATAISVSIAHVGPEIIDREGISAANTRAMRKAILGLSPAPGHVIIDGHHVELGVPTTAVVRGDRLVAAIAAASIVAKVARDAIMRENDALFPLYGFAQNKGYGTLEHMAIIERHGPCSLHRMSFSPCSQQHLF
jgi:ribonuclease HII